MQRISDAGELAEELFRTATKAKKARRSSDGDALLKGIVVEVKLTSTNSVNQVRPLKYTPLAVFHVPTETWFVIPAHVLVKIACSKRRGQHTEISFECMTLALDKVRDFETPAKDLESTVIRAAKEDAQRPHVRAQMQNLLFDLEEMAKYYRAKLGDCS